MSIVRMIRPLGGNDQSLPAQQTWKNKKDHTVKGLKLGGPQTYVMAVSAFSGAIAAANDLDNGSTAYVYADEKGVPTHGVSYTVFTPTVGGTPCEAQFAYFKTFFDDEGKLCAFFVLNEPLFPAAPVESYRTSSVESYAYEQSIQDAYKVWRLQCLVVTLMQIFAETSDADDQDIEEYAAKTFSLSWMKVIKGFEIEGAETLSNANPKKFAALVMNSPAENVRLVDRVKNAVQAAGAAGAVQAQAAGAVQAVQAVQAAGVQAAGAAQEMEDEAVQAVGAEAYPDPNPEAVYAAGVFEEGQILSKAETKQLLTTFGLPTGGDVKKTWINWNTDGFLTSDDEMSNSSKIEWKLWFLHQQQQIKTRVLEQCDKSSAKAGCLSKERMDNATLKARTWFFMKGLPHAPFNIQYLRLEDVRNLNDPIDDPVYVPATIHNLKIKEGVMGYSTKFKGSNVKYQVKVMRRSNKMVWLLFDDLDVRTVDFTPRPGDTNRDAQIKEFKDLFSPRFDEFGNDQAKGWKYKIYADSPPDSDVDKDPNLSHRLWPTRRNQSANKRKERMWRDI